MAIEIVSFPIKNGGSFYSYVAVYPEGTKVTKFGKTRWKMRWRNWPWPWLCLWPWVPPPPPRPHRRRPAAFATGLGPGCGIYGSRYWVARKTWKTATGGFGARWMILFEFGWIVTGV